MDTGLIVWSNVHTINTDLTEKIAMSKMPCHISDGPQEPDDGYTQQEIDEDAAYENFRQQKIDDGECMSCNKKHLPGEIYCEQCLDPTPWCHVCGAMEKTDCQCGTLAPTR
jgi:hypothetical protein